MNRCGGVRQRAMADLTNPKLIYLKGFLFLFSGLLASGILLLDNPSLKAVVLLAVAVWSFARFYYFMFYVIQHYVDPGYRFAGVWSFARYVARGRRGADAPGRGSEPPPPDGPT